MTTKLYVANLTFRTTERDLERLFREYGKVESARLATDRETGRSRGFGFVEMGDAQEAEAAIAGLHGKEIQGRDLIVQAYRPKEGGDRPRRPAPKKPARPPRERKRRPPALGSRLRKPPPPK